MRDIIVNRRLRVEPVNGLDSSSITWTVKSEKGERILKSSLSSPELAVEEAERVLFQSDVRSHERICVEVVTFLSNGEYYVKSRVIQSQHPDNPQRMIDSILFDGVKRLDNSVIVSGEESFVATVLRLQEVIKNTSNFKG